MSMKESLHCSLLRLHVGTRPRKFMHSVELRNLFIWITYNIFRTLVIGRFDMSVKTKEKALNLVDGIELTITTI